MSYPIFSAVWIDKKATRFRVAPFVSLPLLSLGNMMNLEVLESPFCTGVEPTIYDVAQFVVVTSLPWWVSRWLITRPWIFGCLIGCVQLILRNRIEQSIINVYEYLKQQLELPERFKSEEETNRQPDPAEGEYASLNSMRIYLKVQALGFKNIWSMTVLECFCWLITQSENKGEHYLSFESLKQFTEE